MATAVQHQLCEINEEEFSPDLEELEQTRLELITKRRTLIRDSVLVTTATSDEHDYMNDDVIGNDDYDEDIGSDEGNDDEGVNGDIMFISRGQIESLHSQLAGVSMEDNIGTSSVCPNICPPGPKKDNSHEYINQEVIDQVANENTTPVSNLVVPGGGADHEFQRVASSNGYKSCGTPSTRAKKSPAAQASAMSGNLTEFEKRLFMAKHKSKPAMPDIYRIPWYHPGISRHVAECLLLSKSIKDGTYLLRDCVSDEDTVTLSVRCAESVKHYKVVWDGRQFIFGLGKFATLEDFREHFIQQPVISGDSGVLVQLCHSYPRGVSEPAIYHEANVIGNEADTEIPSPPKPTPAKCNKVHVPRFGNSIDLSVNSKEGYLTKLGFHRKNWKKRWFVLYRNELKYFNNCGDKEPLKTINLEDVEKVERDGTVGKPNCLRLVTCYRTFYMYASSEVEAIEWLQILDWRLKQQLKQCAET